MQEIEHAQTTVDAGMVRGVYKVAAQPRVIAIVDMESTEREQGQFSSAPLVPDIRSARPKRFIQESLPWR